MKKCLTTKNIMNNGNPNIKIKFGEKDFFKGSRFDK